MYLNLIQIAESFGVSEQVVEGWIRHDGLPHLADRGRVVFDRVELINWATSRGLTARSGFLSPEAAPGPHGLGLDGLLRAGGIWRDETAASAFAGMGVIIANLPDVTPPIRQLLKQRVLSPGGITYAPVGNGFALPHLAMRLSLGRDSGVIAIFLLKEALQLHEPEADAVPVTRLIFFVAPSPRAHLDLLGRLSRALHHGPLRGLLLDGAPDAAIYEAMKLADAPVSPTANPAPSL